MQRKKNRSGIPATYIWSMTPASRIVTTCLASLVAMLCGCSARNTAFQAIDRNDTATVRQLATQEGFLSRRDSAGITPLLLASALGRERIVTILLEAKAPLDAQDNSGLSALALAVGKGHKDVVRRLLAAGSDPRGSFGSEGTRQPLLSLCVHRRQFASCDLLLEKGAQADATVDGGLTALHIAALEGNLEGIRYLLERKARCAPKDVDGNAAVHLLLRGSSEAKAQALAMLAKGCPDWDPEARDRAGNTPLIVAASVGDTASVRALARLGASLEARDEYDNETALFTGKSESVALLLKLGANPSPRNSAGITPIENAIQSDWNESFRALHGHLSLRHLPLVGGVHKDPLAFRAVAYDRPEMLEYLLDHGTAVDTVDCFQHTLLDRALDDGKEQIAALLCRRGAHAAPEYATKAKEAGCRLP